MEEAKTGKSEIGLELQYNRDLLKEIRDLVKDQNQRIRQNEISIARVTTEMEGIKPWDGRIGDVEESVSDIKAVIASMKTWVTVVGTMMTVGIICAAIVGVLVK